MKPPMADPTARARSLWLHLASHRYRTWSADELATAIREPRTRVARTMGNMITYQFADRANAGTGKGAQYHVTPDCRIPPSITLQQLDDLGIVAIMPPDQP